MEYTLLEMLSYLNCVHLIFSEDFHNDLCNNNHG